MSRSGRAPGGGPFIESYITPDMDMRPVGETVQLIERAGFEVIGVRAMREHYVRTIRAWLDNFEQNLAAVTGILDRRAGPAVAAVPGRRRAGLRGGPDGRRPDPGRQAVSGLPLGPFGLTLLITAASLLGLMAVTFGVALVVGRHSVVDTTWGLGIALAAVVSLLVSAGHGQPGRRYLLLAAAVLWGLRLSGYVTWRNRGQGEDPRYRDLLAKARGNPNLYALRSIYLLQAVTLWLACLPVQAGMLERARSARSP